MEREFASIAPKPTLHSGVGYEVIRIPAVVLLSSLCCNAETTRLSRVEGDFITLSSALKMFWVTTGRYPTEYEGLTALVEKPAGYLPKQRWQRLMDRIPVDPWGQPYRYVVFGEPDDDFGIYTTGKDGTSNSRGNDPDDWNSWSENIAPPEPVQWSSILALATTSIIGLLLVIELFRHARKQARAGLP